MRFLIPIRLYGFTICNFGLYGKVGLSAKVGLFEAQTIFLIFQTFYLVYILLLERMSLKYKSAYSSIGEERIQKAPKTFEDEVAVPTSSQVRRMFQNAEEAFWTPRQDRNWAEIPGYMKFVYLFVNLQFLFLILALDT